MNWRTTTTHPLIQKWLELAFIAEKARKAAGEAEIAAHAEDVTPPLSRRKAIKADFVEGALIWVERRDDQVRPEFGDGKWYWHIVTDVVSSREGDVGYVADDGCVYFSDDRCWIEFDPTLAEADSSAQSSADCQ